VTSSRSSREALADRQLLDLALTQLLDNAVKYSLREGVIAVSVQEEEGCIAISVRNEGDSIAPGEREQIFERFYRGARVRNLVSGTGLGLHIARKIAAAHGGSLSLVNDDRGTGVIFRLKLPMPEPSVLNPVLNHECDNPATAL
jgi:signal transduction histidine kinase